jgi:hypothetical protein
MPWMLLGLIGIAGLAAWEYLKSQTAAPTSTPARGGIGVTYKPGTSQVMAPTSIDESGATLVMVTGPGDLGEVDLVSAATSPPIAGPGNGAGANALDIGGPGSLGAPAGGYAALMSIASSSPSVIPSQLNGNFTSAYSSISAVAMGQPLVPGTTTLTISWMDSAGNQQTSTLEVVAT